MIAALRARWMRVLELAERRLPALTRYRRAEPLPIALHARRVYILPTGYGCFFALVLLAMLLGALNFNNNAALLFTFVVVGAVLAALPRTTANLVGVRLVRVRADPVHAGEPVRIELGFESDDARLRPALRLRVDAEDVPFEISGGSVSLHVTRVTSSRGLHPLGRMTLSTEHPFGLFRAWSVLHPDLRYLVYPRAEPEPPPVPRSAARESGRNSRPGGEDWHGLRDYRSGDPPRRIAWRPSARAERLLVKQYADPEAVELLLDHAQLAGLPPEARISRLTRWVLDSHAMRAPYTLKLPQEQIGPARDDHHRERCLRALALMP